MPKKSQAPIPHERRRRQRRDAKDRRDMIRFELDKEPRRLGEDRRKARDLWAGRD